MSEILLFLACFLLGSLPFGLWVARAFHVVDLREQGSGNVGATNVARVAGFWPAGFLTFLLDFLKGAIPVFLVVQPESQESIRALFGAANPFSESTPWLCGLFAVVGHCFSPWLKFRGGKGVATGFGALLALSPMAALAGLIGFGLTFASSRIGSLSSLAGLLAASIAQVVFFPIGAHLLPGAVMVFVILIRHEQNIEALIKGQERTFR